MQQFLRHTSYLLLSVFLLSTTGCLGDIKSPIQEEDAFKLETFRWKTVPKNIQDQAMGSNCEFMPINNETELYMTGGLIKINGIYEILEEKNTDNLDFNKQIFENSRWIILVEMNPDKSNNNQDTGTLTLRSKEKDGATTVQVQRFCGT